MTLFWKVAAYVASVAIVCGAAMGWHSYKKITNHRRLVAVASALRLHAEQGDAKAQSQLGHIYYHGEGVPQDYAQAFSWYSKAAEQGDAKAQYAVGYMYYFGENVPKDYSQALHWFIKAAYQNYAPAEDILATMYYNGEGAPRNYAESFLWYHKAADQGYVKAQYYLGVMYWYGHGTPQDRDEANRWFRKAATQGDKNAQSALRTPLSTHNKIFISIELLGGILLLVTIFRNGKMPNLRYPGTYAGPLILVCAGLDLYWYSHIEVLRLLSTFTFFYFCKNLLGGITIATLISIVWPMQRSAKSVLRISVALLVAFDTCVVVSHQLKHFALAACGFYPTNGLLIGIAVTSTIFLWISYKESTNGLANHSDGPELSLRI